MLYYINAECVEKEFKKFLIKHAGANGFNSFLYNLSRNKNSRTAPALTVLHNYIKPLVDQCNGYTKMSHKVGTLQCLLDTAFVWADDSSHTDGYAYWHQLNQIWISKVTTEFVIDKFVKQNNYNSIWK